MERKDEEADYHFGHAAAQRSPGQVMPNILRFREAIRARRSWRFNFNFGFAPDSNINAATDKETVVSPASPSSSIPPAAPVRVPDASSAPMLRYASTARGASNLRRRLRAMAAYPATIDSTIPTPGLSGPGIRVAGGQLRVLATGLKRWYGRQPLLTSFGTRLEYEKLVGGQWTIGGALVLRRNDYARRDDVDGWDAEARASVSRPLGPATLGFGYVGSSATGPGIPARLSGGNGSASASSRRSAGGCGPNSASSWRAR